MRAVHDTDRATWAQAPNQPEKLTVQFNISGRAAPYTFAATGVGIVMRDVMLGLLPGTLLYAGFLAGA